MKKVVEIQIPEKLKAPIFRSTKKHRLIKGGRGGAKSESVARALIMFAMELLGNILCTRSVQNSLKDSIYSLIVRIITDHGLTQFFSIKVDGISCNLNGNKFIFKGMNALSDPKSEQAKGLDNIKVCHIEEAHTVTERDIEVLLPSVRADDCFFLYTYNSNKEPCYVSEYFGKHPDAEFTEIHYYENPFLPKTLFEEAEALKLIDPEKYRQVWLGEPSTDTSKQVLIKQWVDSAIALYRKESDNEDGARIYGLDIADEGEDDSALCMRKGLAVISMESWHDSDTTETAEKAVKKVIQPCHLIYDRVGMGAGVKATLKRIGANIPTTPYSNGDAVANPHAEHEKGSGLKNKDVFGNFGAQHWFFIRKLMKNAYLKSQGQNVDEYITINPEIKNLLQLKRELLQIQFYTNTKEQILIQKKPAGTKSPNLADAFMMCLRKPKVLASVIS